MKATTKYIYDEETLEFARHMRMISSVDRIVILKTLQEFGQCRVTQLAMEAGTSHRQVYYQLSVLQKMNYVVTRYSGGRYLVFLGLGVKRHKFLVQELLKNLGKNNPSESSPEHGNLRVVR